MSETSSLEVAIRHRVGSLALDLAFTLREPWTILFAPSGSGKSTILRILAGLMRPDSGRLVWTSQNWTVLLADSTSGAFIPPHRRAIRFVGQQAALFPHRSVLANATYAMKPSKTEDRRKRIGDLLALCRITHLAGRMPSTLSGGERQRVAIARAIAADECRMLLLDEPFSALDTTMRRELVHNLKVWLAERNIPVLQVTHDVGEVFELGAHVIRLREGRLLAQGPPELVLAEERNELARQINLALPV